jgi:hypothetical protein
LLDWFVGIFLAKCPGFVTRRSFIKWWGKACELRLLPNAAAYRLTEDTKVKYTHTDVGCIRIDSPAVSEDDA